MITLTKEKQKKGKAFFENNSWYHRTKVLQTDGSVKYSKKGGFSSSKEAEQSYDQYEEEFKRAYQAYHNARCVNTEIMLKEYLIYWFEELFSIRIEATTKMVGAYAIYDLILPQIEYDIKLKYVNTEYLDMLLTRVAVHSKSAGNKGREILYLAFKEAVAAGYLKSNPVANTKPYKRVKPKVMILGKENIKKLLKYAKLNNWYLEILLALFCGLRKGEILGLKFDDFDFEKNTVTINRQLVSDPKVKKGSSEIEVYGYVERAPKTQNSFRTLRVPDVVMAEVKKRQIKIECEKLIYADVYVDYGYISCQTDGKPHSQAAMNLALTKLCIRNGLPAVSVHGLRHMYATILLEQSVPIVKISALLGHESVHTTFEYYCDVMDENENIVAFMNQMFVPVA